MKEYNVKPIRKSLNYSVKVPGSKSITNRALLLAAMANGRSKLSNVLFSDDSRHFINCLRDLGYDIEVDEVHQEIIIMGGIPNKTGTIDTGSAGTGARFLVAMLSVFQGEYIINASNQMKKRPMRPLFDALKQLNVNVTFLEKENHLPVVIRGGNNRDLDVTLDAEMSSQFTSALLMSGAKYESGLNIHLIGKEIAKSYVDITLNMIKQFGGVAYKSYENIYKVRPINSYLAQEYYIEPDVSSACYFFAMAALIGGSVLVEGVHLNSIQGDIKFLTVLRRLGCIIEDTDKGIKVTGPKNAEYEGIDVDMNDFSDQTMTMAVLAIFASSPTRIRNIQHIKYQETNRISATINELTKLGIKVDETDDGIIIYPSTPKTASIETYEDHRMAMAFSLVGLRGEGIVIKNPDCVSKTFETYFSELDKLIKAHT